MITPLSAGPERGSSEIEITVSHGDRSVRGPEDDEALPSCVGLHIDVLVTVRSTGGALDEQFEATLLARDPDQASLYADLDPAAVQGALAVEGLSSDMTWRLSFNLEFAPSGPSGVVEMVGAQPSQCEDDGECSDSGAGHTLARIGPEPGS